MLIFGIGAVASAWIGFILAAVIEAITNSFDNKNQGSTWAWGIVIVIAAVLCCVNVLIGGFLFMSLFWSYIILSKK